MKERNIDFKKYVIGIIALITPIRFIYSVARYLIAVVVDVVNTRETTPVYTPPVYDPVIGEYVTHIPAEAAFTFPSFGITLAMALCAIYVFFSYNKKKSILLGISVGILAVQWAIYIIFSIRDLGMRISILEDMGFHIYHFFLARSIAPIALVISFAIIFSLVALKYFNIIKIKITAKGLLLIALILQLTNVTVMPLLIEVDGSLHFAEFTFSLSRVLSNMIRDFIFSLPNILPFFLLAHFSPEVYEERYLVDIEKPEVV